MTHPAYICVGDVVHHRMRPRTHKLRYRVFSLLIDLDRIDEAAKSVRWFAHNRWNLLSHYDCDHLSGGRQPLRDKVRHTLVEAGLDTATARIWMLAYPRVFGYVFNPLSVYYAYGADGRLMALIYEVNNTFSERTSYVLPAGALRNGTHAQTCAKTMFVSPFAPGAGRYGFRVTDPVASLKAAHAPSITVGVQFHDHDGPLIRTHFRGAPKPLTGPRALAAGAAIPFMTLKVIFAIHWEALKLWLKGVPLIQGHASPRYAVNTNKEIQQD